MVLWETGLTSSSETKNPTRITCSCCEKLLFKVTRDKDDDLVELRQYEIEIKCHNSKCKAINVIKL